MRGPKPNYAKDGVKSNYGPKPPGLTPGSTPEEPDSGQTGLPQPGCVAGISGHIQPNQEIWLTPSSIGLGAWAPGRQADYYRIVVDPGGGGEISSGNIAWDEVFVIPNGCAYAGPSPGVPWAVELYAGNSFGEDFCGTTLTLFDLQGACP